MSRRVYRVIATYPDGTWTRHYLTKTSADRQAARRLAGFDAQVPNGFGGVEEVPVSPALAVRVEVSDPVTWSA